MNIKFIKKIIKKYLHNKNDEYYDNFTEEILFAIKINQIVDRNCKMTINGIVKYIKYQKTSCLNCD
jgi:hypothetical protein